MASIFNSTVSICCEKKKYIYIILFVIFYESVMTFEGIETIFSFVNYFEILTGCEPLSRYLKISTALM